MKGNLNDQVMRREGHPVKGTREEEEKGKNMQSACFTSFSSHVIWRILSFFSHSSSHRAPTLIHDL